MRMKLIKARPILFAALLGSYFLSSQSAFSYDEWRSMEPRVRCVIPVDQAKGIWLDR